MIIQGLAAFKQAEEGRKETELIKWFVKHPEITKGTRPDVYASIVLRERERQRILELEEENSRLREDEHRARCNAEMYEAMGPEYDENAFATFP
jgi:hypothetical protein